MSHEHDCHLGLDDDHLAPPGNRVAVTRRLVLLAGGATVASLLSPPDGVAAGVTGETRAGRRRKRQRRRMRRPGGVFRTSSVKVANRTREPLHVSFYYQPEQGTDYDPPVTDGKTYSVFPDSWETYAPGQFRIGVLIHDLDPQDDLYVDMRNVALWYPRAGVYQARLLDPTDGWFGYEYIPEQNYSEREEHKRNRVLLRRASDSDYYIEWVLEISPGKL